MMPKIFQESIKHFIIQYHLLILPLSKDIVVWLIHWHILGLYSGWHKVEAQSAFVEWINEWILYKGDEQEYSWVNSNWSGIERKGTWELCSEILISVVSLRCQVGAETPVSIPPRKGCGRQPAFYAQLSHPHILFVACSAIDPGKEGRKTSK